MRAALERRQQSSWTPDPGQPLLWWSRQNAAEHSEWLSLDLQPIAWERCRWIEQHWAGQPVILRTAGRQHLAYVRLSSCRFRRWLTPGEGGLIDPCELTMSDPRQGPWQHPYLLQLGLALLDAERSPQGQHAWLAGSWEETPDLAALLEEARSALVEPERWSATTRGPGGNPWAAGAVDMQPARRAWTEAEIQAMGFGRKR